MTVTQYLYLYDKGSFTFYLDFYFRLSLRRLSPDLIVYRSNTADVLSESGTAYPSQSPQFIPGFFGEFHVAHLFIFLCCHIMCIYVRSSMLWCPLRFRIKWCSVRLYRSRRAHCPIYFIFVCLRIMVSKTFCVLFLLCLSSSCCTFPWIAHFWRSLRY